MKNLVYIYTHNGMETIQFRLVMSVHPHATTWLPLEGFSCNLIVESISKFCQEDTNLIKIGQE